MDNHSDINIIGYWRILVKRKGLIGLIVASAFIVSVFVSLTLPKIYVSTASILPPQSEGGLDMASRFSSELSGLAGGFLGGKSTGDLWVGILNSHRIFDAIIERFGISDRYGTATVDDARTALKGVVQIEKAKKGDIISVTVEDKDPKMAASIANAFVEELDRVNRSLVMSAGQRMRTFVEARLKEAKEALVRTEEEVRSFQDRNRAVKLDDQSKAIIGAIGSIKGLLMAKEVELQTLLSFATSNNPQAQLLKSEIEGLHERLNELEEGKSPLGGASTKDIFIPTAHMPNLNLQYMRLLREARIQETLFGLLTQQYEMARIQEAKDTPTIQVLDVAKAPEKRSKPNRRKIVLLSTVSAGLLSILAVFVLEYLEGIKKTDTSDLIEQEKQDQIRDVYVRAGE